MGAQSEPGNPSTGTMRVQQGLCHGSRTWLQPLWFAFLLPSPFHAGSWQLVWAAGRQESWCDHRIRHSPAWQPNLISVGAECGSQPKLSLLTGNKAVALCVLWNCSWKLGSQGNEHCFYLLLAPLSMHCCLSASETGSDGIKKRGFRFIFCIPQPLTENKGSARWSMVLAACSFATRGWGSPAVLWALVGVDVSPSQGTFLTPHSVQL